MSKLPLSYPENERGGAGRRVVLTAFQDQENAGYQDSIIKQLSNGALKVHSGKDLANTGFTVILADIELNEAIPEIPGTNVRTDRLIC